MSAIGHDHPSARLQETSPQRPASDKWFVASAAPLESHAADTAWHALFAADATSSIHQHPDFPPTKLQRKDGIARLCGRWTSERVGSLASLAMFVPKRMHVSILPGMSRLGNLRTLRLVGNQILGDRSADSLAGFVDSIASLLSTSGYDAVYVEEVEVESRLWSALVQAGAERDLAVAYPTPPQPHWWIRFPPRTADYWDKFSGKSRYNLRRAAKKLPHSLHRITQPEQVQWFLEHAQSVSEKSWQGRRLGTRMTNSAEARTTISFLAAHGALRSYILEANGRPVAFLYGIQWNGRFIYEEVGFDSSFSAESPGTVLLFDVLSDLVAHDCPELLDFGFGDGGYKQFFANHQTESGPILVIRRTWRNMTLLGARTLRQCVARSSRYVVARLGMRGVLRRLYRRQAGAT